MNTDHTAENSTSHTTACSTRPGLGRLARGAAALTLAVTAAFGSTALAVADAGAWVPSPDNPFGEEWSPVLPPTESWAPVTPPTTTPPSPVIPRVTLPDSVFQPVLPDPADLALIPELPDPPSTDGGLPVPSLPDRIPESVPLTPIGPGRLLPDGPSVPEPTIPPIHGPDCLSDTPSGWGSGSAATEEPPPCDPMSPGGLGYPDGEGMEDECLPYDPPANAREAEALGQPGEFGPGTCDEPGDPEATPVRVESATGSLAFTGSDLALPLAGAGLLGGGGVLAGISVLARRTRSGRP